jgi:hypothetical protein
LDVTVAPNQSLTPIRDQYELANGANQFLGVDEIEYMMCLERPLVNRKMMK